MSAGDQPAMGGDDFLGGNRLSRPAKKTGQADVVDSS
jgi:hypothetical protein